jgi:hypothetical protein
VGERFQVNTMGDKSPKSVKKQAGQKQGREDAAKTKRDVDEAARVAAKVPPKK